MERLGIALGGGAARGFAHVGVVRAMRKHPEYIPAIVGGTSAGSIIAALFAGGVEQERLEAEVREFDWYKSVVSVQETARNLLDTRRGGMVSNLGLEETVNELIGGRTFDQLPKELAIVTTDLEHGRRVIYTSSRAAESIDRATLDQFLPPPVEGKPGSSTVVIGDMPNVGRAVAASCAIPGIFHPVKIDDLYLVDGGIVDQVPVDVVKAMGATPAIGVSLSFSRKPDSLKTIGSVFSAVIGMLGTQQLRRSLDLADIGFQIPGIESRSLVDVRQYDLMDIGEETMERQIGRLKRLSLESRQVGVFRRAISGLIDSD